MMNIAGTSGPIEDANYRYKMPRFQTKVEGRGNGIKTVVINMKDVADALHRGPAEITKFFGTELGAQTSYKDDTERSIVNGAHTAQALQQLLCKYIQGFVLCPSCQLPETAYKIKGGVIFQKCDACGEKSMVDMGHKLTTFIINSHKKSEKGGKDAKKKKKERAAAAAAAAADGGEEDGEGGGGGEEKEKKKKKKKDKDKEKKDRSSSSSKKKKKKDKEKASEGGSSDGEGGVKRGSSAGSGSGGSAGSGSDDDDGDANGDDDVPTMDNLSIEDATALASAVQRMEQFLLNNTTATPSEVLDELRMISTFNALPVEERMFLFVQAAFGPECAKGNAVGKHKAVLKGLILSVDAEAYQRRLIGVMEHLCAVRFPELRKWFPLLLKQLFDEDIVEEDVFLEWAEEEGPSEFTRREVSGKMVEELRGEAAKFVTWLKEADSDSEGDDDDESSSSSSSAESDD